MGTWIRNLLLLMTGIVSLSAWAGESEARVGIATGITTVDQAQLQSDSVTNVFYLGVSGDYGITPFLGIEGEAYYGTGSVERGFNGFIQNRVGTMEQWAFMANAKFEYPLEAENWIIRPKAGVGFGYVSLGLKNDYQTYAQANLFNVGATSHTFGVYGVIGVEAEPGDLMLLSADFAFSFAATREFDAGFGVAPIPFNTQSPGFTRLRLGAHFRLNETMLLGGQFNERNLTGTMPLLQGFTGDLTPAQRHFLLSFLFSF